MNMTKGLLALGSTAVLVAGCTTPTSLSQQTFGRKFPVLQDAGGPQVAYVRFSSDRKYESEKGVPLAGDPLICSSAGLFRVNPEDPTRLESRRITVESDQEIAVTSVIRWSVGMFEKTCWPFAAFTPEVGASYVVVNERIGGKGISALWTGVGLQTCQVSVFKEIPGGMERVPIRTSTVARCQSPMR